MIFNQFFNGKVSRLIAALMVAAFVIGCSSGSSSSGGRNKAPTKIVAIGDSIGDASFGSTAPWPARVEDITMVPVANYARQSQSTDDFVGVVGGILDAEQPSHLMILLGTNDAREGRVGSAVSNIQFMVNEANARDIKVIVGTVPPSFRNDEDNQRSAQISEGIRTISGAEIAEVRDAFGNDSSFFPDGLHPDSRGEQIIAELMVGEL